MYTLEQVKFIFWLTMFAKRELSTVEIDDIFHNIRGFSETVNSDSVNELLAGMNMAKSGKGIIPAIKAYRTITNMGLKEAKEAVEKYV